MKKRLTPAQKKVRLAKDVIALIKAGTIKPTVGTYFSADLKSKTKESNLKELGKLIKTSIKGPCYVCAQGALIVAKALRFDKAKVSDRDTGDDYGAVCYVAKTSRYVSDDGKGFYAYLKETFGNDVKLIESAFEGWGGTHYDDYPNADKRLIVIMKNIIRNKGKFKPNDSKDEVK